MFTQTHTGNLRASHTRRLLTSLVAVALFAGSAPATPVLGGPEAGLASQESGGGGGP